MRVTFQLQRRLALGFATCIAMVTGMAPALAAEPGTASRLQADESRPMFPVAVYDRETIERSGHVMLADFLHATVFNSGGSSRPALGLATYSTWALGSGRNMVLIDGRRVPVAPNTGDAQDLSAIPLAMVERIEILPQAAAAIHGADAVGGVVNVITRRGYDGAEVMVAASDPTREGGETAEFSALVGVSGDRGNITFGVSREYRGVVWARDRSWSRFGRSLFANNFMSGSSLTEFYNNPSNGAVVPGQGCTGANFDTTIIVSDLQPVDACVYEFPAVASGDVEVATQSLFTRSELELREGWKAYLDARVSRVETFDRLAASPSSPWPNGLPRLVAGSPNHPATSPANGGLNPEWLDYQDVAGTDLWLMHRFVGVGPRDTITDKNNYTFDLGVKGRLGETDLQLGVRHQESRYSEIAPNRIVMSIAQSYIESGEYDIYDPYGVDDGVANSISATANREAAHVTKSVYLDAGMTLFELPGGPVEAVFGGEYREIDFHDRPDSLSEGGQLTSSSGISKDAGRNVKSFFGEAMLPLAEALDLNLALRYDGYSDVGDGLGARIALGYEWTDSLYLRAQVSRAPNAPSIDMLSRAPVFSQAQIRHFPSVGSCPALPPCLATLTGWELPNPELAMEESSQSSIGMVFKPVDTLELSLDYQDTHIDDLIRYYGPQAMVNCLEGAFPCPDGVSLLDPGVPGPNPAAGLGVAFTNGPGTAISYIQSGLVNTGELDVETLAFRASAEFEVAGGMLRHELRLSQLLSYRYGGGSENVGDYGFPERRAVLRNSYDFGDISASWNLNYIGPQDVSAGGSSTGVDSWLTHDIQLGYVMPWDARIALGVINLTDEDPPLDIFEPRGYNFSLFNGYGRVPYLRYTQSF